jgi:hypothetical protein
MRMDKHLDRPELTIRTPCPKRWEELSGDGRRRFCSECSLHVHNAAAMTRREAEALVAGAEGRVCMRIECDPSGAPVFREPRAARLARWAMSAGAALLAACHGGQAPAPTAPPAQPVEAPAPMGGVTTPEITMGKVAAPERMGDVASPPVQPRETLGEASPATPVPPKPK